jgi:hypothetical protein
MVEWETEDDVRKGRRKERWMDGLRPSMTSLGLTEEGTSDRGTWRNEFWVKENHCIVDSHWMDE